MMGEDAISAEDFSKRCPGVACMASRPWSLGGYEFNGGSVEEKQNDLATSRVLVVGAGGLGCEILKDLAMSGFGSIDVIDMDVVEYSNLNRQFLFRKEDVHKPKAVVAAEFVNKRVGRDIVTPHYCKLQDKPSDWYRQFRVIIAGLDSLNARRWLNATVCKLVRYCGDEVDPTSIIPLIDGGSEGFKGHVRCVVPTLTACLECSKELNTPQERFALCTIASEPRLPEHCIVFATDVAWKSADYINPFGKDTTLDPDNPDHIKWVFETASKYADEKGIPGVTLKLTQGVVKHIVPAIAATNSIIAAACVNEAFKTITASGTTLEDSLFYNGSSGAYFDPYQIGPSKDCFVCSSVVVSVDPNQTLKQLIDTLISSPKFGLKDPSISFAGGNLFMTTSGLREATESNLTRTLRELGLTNGSRLTVTDEVLSCPLGVIISFNGETQD